MFSPEVSESSRIVEMTFIAGVPYQVIKSKVHDFLNFQNVYLKTEILFSFPNNEGTLLNSIIDFIFPTRISISYSEEKAKFYSIVLTNGQGIRSHCYILKVYEKISIQDLIDEHSENKMRLFKRGTIISALNYEVCEENKGDDNLYKEYKGKAIYVPYAICIMSTVSNVEFFKQITSEIYKIILYDNPNLNEENLRNYKFCEVLHLMIFISNMVVPPAFVKMNLNLRFSQIEFCTDSVYKLPCADDHIKILFETLELSTIIKLWCSILTEKHIIILANQNFLLYSICEALLSLIFPFKWLHTYIPVLPHEQLDYLESPTPYIMGVLSSYTDLDYLKENLPNHVICDVNTSIIYGNAYCCLPLNEESKLRKKINHARNPHINNLENVIKNELNGDASFPIEDVSFSRPFTTNVQHIFFRIFKNSLQNIKHKYLRNGVFNYQQFLEEFHDYSLREFWEKIINTSAFEFFTLSFQYLDFSNTKIFNNICKFSDEKLESLNSKNNIYTFNFTLPENMNIIFRQIIYNNQMSTQTKSNVIKYKKSYGNVIKHNLMTNVKTNFSSIKKINEPIRKKRTQNLSYDFKNFNNKLDDKNEIMIIEKNDMSNVLRNQDKRQSFKSKYNFLSLNNNKFKEISCTDTKIKFNKNKINTFSLYGENGFLNFVKDLITYDGDNLIEYGYHSELIKVIKSHILGEVKNNPQESNEFHKINETDEDSEFENYFNSSFKNIKSISSENINEEILIISKVENDSYQYNILLAFYLDEYSLQNNHILEFYKKANKIDKKSFPRVRFLQYLFNFTLNELKNFLTQELEEYPLLKKIIKSRINSIENSKRSEPILQKQKDKKKYEILLGNSVDLNSSENLTKSFATSSIDEQSEPEEEEDKIELNDEEKDAIEELERKFTYNSTKAPKYRNSSKGLVTQIGNHVINEPKYKSSFFVGGNFDSKVDAQKILETFKANDLSSKDKNVGKYVINYFQYNSYNIKNNKDPIKTAEDISLRIFSIIMKNSLNKLKPEMITPNLLNDISNSSEFEEIKNLVGELQKVDIKIINTNKNNNFKICFWLNIFNFLCIFTIIYKKEILTNNYEWCNFLSKSYFNIGGFEFSLLEIENCILKNKIVFPDNYGKAIIFEDDDERKNFQIENSSIFLHFGISLPTISFPSLKIYFPNNLTDLLKFNANEFFAKNINLDFENNIINIPEFLNWVDENFIENINKYDE